MLHKPATFQVLASDTLTISSNC